MDYAEMQFILSKDSERREKKNQVYLSFFSEPHPILSKDNKNGE